MAGYIGSQTPVVSNGSQRKYTFTATAAQTVFTGMDIPNPQQIQVFQNGVRLVITTDYSVSSGTTVTLVNAASAGDSLVVILFADYQLLDQDLSGNFSVDSPTFVVDSANNRVGVGTVSPSATLDVNGTIKLDGNYPVGTGNVALGDAALDDGSLTGNYNVAVGLNTLTALTSGGNNTALGANAGFAATTADMSVFVGRAAGVAVTTGDYNTAIGAEALKSNTTASDNTAVGYQAGYSNTTGVNNTAVGKDALLANTTANNNTAIGFDALTANTTGVQNVSVGSQSMISSTTGSNNVSVGMNALFSNTTASDNTAVGYLAGRDCTTGTKNTFLGRGAGFAVTTGSKNVVVGAHSGNFGGLDIRTANNYIVLSDGDGNPRGFFDTATFYCTGIYNTTTGSAANTVVLSNGALLRSTSSLRYKNTINDATHGLTELLSLRPVTYKGNNDGDTVFGGLIAEEVHDAGLTEFVQYNDDGEPDALAYGNMVSLCIKAIQEQQATITALETRITTLETENTAIKARLDALEGN